MSDGMGREFTYLSSHATNRYLIPNWGIVYSSGKFNILRYTSFSEYLPFHSGILCRIKNTSTIKRAKGKTKRNAIVFYG